MDSPAHLLLVLALTVGCALAQLGPPTQAISAGSILRNNRNPTTTPSATITPSASQPASSSATTTTTTSVSEQQKPPSQILTPFRNRTTTTTTTTNYASSPSVTSTQSSTLAADADTNESDTTNVDPYLEDLCIRSLEDVYWVNAVWDLGTDSCRKRCRCVFKDEPRDPKNDILIEISENLKHNSADTEIRCGLPEKCSDIADRLVPSRRCPEPVMFFQRTNIETCECPVVSCGFQQPELQSTVSQAPKRILSPIPTQATTAASTTTTTTVAPTSTAAAATTVQASITAAPLTTTVSPPTIATTSSVTKIAPKLTTLQQSQTQAAAATTTTEVTTTTNPATNVTLYTDTTSTISSRPATTATNRQATGELRAVSSSIIQAIDVPLEKYAAHLLIALAMMTTLFVVVSFLYLRRAFRSSMVPISDCYENPAFTKQPVLHYDVTDQNYRNKNKEADGF